MMNWLDYELAATALLRHVLVKEHYIHCILGICLE